MNDARSCSLVDGQISQKYIDFLSNTLISGNEILEICQKLVKPLSVHVPLKLRAQLLQTLCKFLENDPPAHVEFYGIQSNYISLKSAGLFNCPRGYTITLWICIENWDVSKRVTLFKLRSDEVSVEALLTYGNSPECVTITFLISLSSSSGSIKQFEMQGTVNIQPKKWQFMTVKHSTQMNRSHASFCMNRKDHRGERYGVSTARRQSIPMGAEDRRRTCWENRISSIILCRVRSSDIIALI